MSKWFENKNVRIAGIVAGAAALLVLVFFAGVLVGARAFRPFSPFPGPFLFLRLGGHGAIGTVTKIEGNVITMTDREEQVRTVNVTTSTLIQVGREFHKQLQDIHVGDRIVVIGSPTDNAIQARFIRVDRGANTPGSTPAPLRLPFFGDGAVKEGSGLIGKGYEL